MDACEVGIVDILRLAQHYGIDSPRTVRNLLGIEGRRFRNLEQVHWHRVVQNRAGLIPGVWLPT